MVDGLRNRVREVREAKGWTQLELAERAGVSRKTINTIENATLNPSTYISLRLARVLEASVEGLFWLDGADRPG